MRKLTLVLLFVCSLVSGQEWQSLTPAIVRLDLGNSGGAATVVGVKDGIAYLITAEHVVRGYVSAIAYWQDGYSANCNVLGSNAKEDVAILNGYAPANAVVIPVAAEAPPQNAQLDAFGYGGQMGSPMSRLQLRHYSVRLRGYLPFVDTEYWMSMGQWASEGDSGGPILYNNCVVGVLSSYQSNTRDSVGPHIGPIRKLLREILPYGMIAGIDARRAQRATQQNVVQQVAQQRGQCPGGT